MEKKDGPSRREFIETVGLIGAAGAMGAMVAGCGGVGEQYADYPWPPLLDQAPDGPVLRAGLIGCGGRGTGAVRDFLSAGPNLEIVALADCFRDRVGSCRETLREEEGVEVPDEFCFDGFDAYERLLETEIDLVLMATPPYFRPEHFEACVDARKHVFMEKPVAVDPVGARSVMASARTADGLGLSVVTGTQRRHQANYLETFRRVTRGAIGDVVSANCYWNGQVPWWRERQSGWSDMEYMVRDWVNWTWLSGDHIVEQHVHNLDAISWFLGDAHPEKAVGVGGRWRRPSGDQYDFFSIDFSFENDVHVHSMCRQIAGCTNNVSEFVRGSDGYTNCVDKIWQPDGTLSWEYPYELDEEGEKIGPRPYRQEHVDLVTAVRTNSPVNEAYRTAVSTLIAIMGRISCYTGQEVTWDEMMESGLKLGPGRLAFGPSELVRAVVPVPGTE
ncbi:MAG: Gfo/Idh/MocA family oxidoreductase [Gemmatimonadota bacterium]|nr:MAG: Gfo/Idh/MocA family oxidoreductase [Gemmatimonadota bacterium]